MKKLIMLVMVVLAGWVFTLNDGTVYKGKSIKNDTRTLYQTQKLDSGIVILVMENGVEINMPWGAIKSVERDEGVQK